MPDSDCEGLHPPPFPEKPDSSTPNRLHHRGLGRLVQPAAARERRGWSHRPRTRSSAAKRHVDWPRRWHPRSEPPVSNTANRPLGGGLGRVVATAVARKLHQRRLHRQHRRKTATEPPWRGPPRQWARPQISASIRPSRRPEGQHRGGGTAARLGTRPTGAAAARCGAHWRQRDRRRSPQPRTQRWVCCLSPWAREPRRQP